MVVLRMPLRDARYGIYAHGQTSTYQRRTKYYRGRISLRFLPRLISS